MPLWDHKIFELRVKDQTSDFILFYLDAVKNVDSIFSFSFNDSKMCQSTKITNRTSTISNPLITKMKRSHRKL